MNILITGSNGFLGSYLSNYLSKWHNVISLVRSRKDISIHNDNVQYIICDLRNKELLMNKLDKIDLDVVIHLAAITKNRINSSFNENIVITKNLLDCIKDKKIKQFVYTSTCGVYGDVDLNKVKEPIDEDYQCYPNYDYTISKFRCEKILKNYANQYSFNYTTLRLSVIYDMKTCPFSELLNFVKSTKIIPLINSGKNYIQPISISDVKRVFRLIVNNSESFNETFNLSGPKPIRFVNLIRLMENELGLKRYKINIPLKFALFILGLSGLVELLGFKTIFNKDKLKRVCENSYYNTSKIEDLLNIKMESPNEGIRNIIRNS